MLLPPRYRLGGRIGLALWTAAVVLMVWSFTIDDAFIVLRYADQILSGGGYGMNPGVPSDGITGPLWLVVPLLTGTSSGLGLKVAGLISLACAVDQVRRAFVGADFGGSLWALAALLLPASVIVWSIAGLETPMAMAMVAVLVRDTVTRGKGPLGGVAVYTALVVVPWLRPELVPAAGILALGTRRRGAWLAVALGVVSVTGFRWVLFDALLPLSFYAKGGSLGQGVAYAVMGALGLSGGALLGLRPRGRPERYLAGALAIHWLVVALAGGDWMPGPRLLVPMMPAYAVLLGRSLRRAPHRNRWGASFALGVAVAVGLFQSFAARQAASYRQHAAASMEEVVAAAEGPLGAVDVGWVGWLARPRGPSPRLVVDLGGITDGDIARMPGNHVDREVDLAFLEAQGVSQFLLHSMVQPRFEGANADGNGTTVEGRLTRFFGFGTENRLVTSPWFQRNYEPVAVIPYAPAYWYVRFDRHAAP